MNISSERLRREAEATGYRPEVLEKVIHLLNLLEALRSHSFLKDRLVPGAVQDLRLGGAKLIVPTGVNPERTTSMSGLSGSTVKGTPSDGGLSPQTAQLTPWAVPECAKPPASGTKHPLRNAGTTQRSDCLTGYRASGMPIGN